MEVKAHTRMIAKHKLESVTVELSGPEARLLHEGLCLLSTYVLARDDVQAAARRLKAHLFEQIEDCV